MTRSRYVVFEDGGIPHREAAIAANLLSVTTAPGSVDLSQAWQSAMRPRLAGTL